MTEVWLVNQPIRVVADGDGLPVRFEWRGAVYQVAERVEHWQVDSDWWHTDGRVWCSFYAVITTTHLLCVLGFDHLANQWRLVRVYD